jgi:enoyl-CoA hydratase/carnithine racemase
VHLQDKYFAAYRSLKLTRDANGVLVVEFHTKGGPFRFTAQDHTEFVDAFYRIAQDRENKIVILTGAGGEFIPEIDFSSFGNVADPGVWSQVHDEGRENPNHEVAWPRNRADGAEEQNRSRSIKWAEKQEKIQPKEMCFFLTSTFIEPSGSYHVVA